MMDPSPAALDSPLTLALLLLGYFVAGVIPFAAILYAVYFLLTLPMRRNERARLFLDLLELGLAEGQTPESAIMSASTSRDRAPGARFHLLSAYLEQDLRFNLALDRVPHLLPPRVTAMLKVGDRIGDIRKVLPACRRSLQDGISHVRGAYNYLIVLAFVITPISALIPLFLRIKVVPTFRQVMEGLFEDRFALPFLSRFVLSDGYFPFVLQSGLLVLVWALMAMYIGGPYFERGFHRLFRGPIFYWPWTRKRLYRDFSAMLAVLLDAGVPEAEAIKLAGDSTATRFIVARAARIRQLLEQGVKLPEAIQTLGEGSELRWRLANALRRGKDFLGALSGWHESLEARAFQLEQSAAQVSTTALVLVNGIMVAVFMIGIFWAIISIINLAVLW